MENKIILQASQISIGYSHKANNSSFWHFYFFKKGKLIVLIGANGIGNQHFKNNNRNRNR
jgi:iron complex transport system ATP-binding protein